MKSLDKIHKQLLEQGPAPRTLLGEDPNQCAAVIPFFVFSLFKPMQPMRFFFLFVCFCIFFFPRSLATSAQA